MMTHTDEMFLQLHGRVKALSTLVADMKLGSVWVMAELVMLVKQLLVPGGVVAQLALANVGIGAVVLLVHNCHEHGKKTRQIINSSTISQWMIYRCRENSQ